MKKIKNMSRTEKNGLCEDYRKEKNKRGNALKLKLQIQLIREGKYMA